MKFQGAENMGGGWLGELPQYFAKSFNQIGRMWMPDKFPGGDFIVEEIRKAIATGALTGYGDATPLRLENLDAQMTEVLIMQSHLKMFNAFPRVPSMQPRYEWIRHLTFGGTRRAPGFVEGGVPAGGVSSWVRGEMMNKYMGVKRGYTHPALITGQMGGFYNDPITNENRDGTTQLLSMIERWILWGDKDIKDGNGVEVNYDGIYQQLIDAGSGSIIDLEGQPLDFNHLEDLGVRFVERGKLLSFNNIKTFTKPYVLSDLAALKLNSERASLGATFPAGYRPGTPLLGYATQMGNLPFEPSIMMDGVDTNAPLGTSDPGVTAAKPATTLPVASSDLTSKMEAGTYYYFASTMEDKGETDSRVSAATAVAALEKVTVTIARVTTATAYRIYRGLTNVAADARWIATIAQPGSGDGVFVDLNQIRPDTGIFLAINMDPEDVAIAQMSPLIKFPLAVVQTQYDFLLLLYHVLAIKAHERVYMIKNIGRRV